MAARRWRYAGQRFGQKTKRVHAWLDHDEEMRVYAGLKGRIVGGEYDVEVDEDDGSVFKQTPQYVGRGPDDDMRKEWTVEDEAVEGVLRAEAAERKALAEHDPLGEMTLDEIVEHYWSLHQPGQQMALLGRVIGRITGKRATRHGQGGE